MPHPQAVRRRHRRSTGLVVAASLGAILSHGQAGAAPPPASHTFVLTYRDFGPISSDAGFRPTDGYQLRFEGCFAKHSAEAVCGFTLKATRAILVTNARNLSHGAHADGSAMRTCCMFVQGDARGYPITTAADAPAALRRPLQPGQELGLMLRVPDYGAGAPLASITFSRGEGDPGETFPARVVELP